MERLTFFAPSRDADIEITVKRSRFIGSVRLLTDAASAQQKVSEVAQIFPKATHYAWAYKTTAAQPLEHASDAGEPSGTAGRPILGAIKRANLDNTIIIVTRYFGGVKLGVRGLIDAYGEAAQLAAEACMPTEMQFCKKLALRCDYAYSKTLLSSLDKFGFDEEKRSTHFGQAVEVSIDVPLYKINEMSPAFEQLYLRKLIAEPKWAGALQIRPCVN